MKKQHRYDELQKQEDKREIRRRIKDGLVPLRWQDNGSGCRQADLRREAYTKTI
jgi:hypothetical protein